MFLVELIASSFFYLISKQARLACRCKRVFVYNNFVGSNGFFARELGLKVQNIEPINLAYILIPKCQNVTSYLVTSFIRIFQILESFVFFLSILKDLFREVEREKKFFNILHMS